MGAGASSLRVEDVVRTAQSEVAYEYPLGEPRAVRHAIASDGDDGEDAMMTWRGCVAIRAGDARRAHDVRDARGDDAR